MAAPWLSETPQGILIRIHAQPKASRTEVMGPHGDRLKIRVAAPPVEGAANEELLRFLKKQLKGAQLSLLRGDTSKQKDVLCIGLTAAEIEARLPS